MLDERSDYARQHIARLRMRRGDGERAAVAGAGFVLQRTQGPDIVDDTARNVNDMLPGRRKPDDAIARPQEDFKSEFGLEQLNLAADARL